MYSLYTWQSFCVKFIPIVNVKSIGKSYQAKEQKEEAHCANNTEKRKPGLIQAALCLVCVIAYYLLPFEVPPAGRRHLVPFDIQSAPIP